MDVPTSAPPDYQREAVEVRLESELMEERMFRLLEKFRAVGHEIVEKIRRVIED